MAKSITVVVIDGHTLTRYGLVGLVAGAGDIEIVGECGSAAEAAVVVAVAVPDVVVLDVALPDGDGLRVAAELRDRYAELGIVVLTSNTEDHVLFRALETGVSAFVCKTAPNVEVLAAIRHASVAACSFTATGLAGALGRRSSIMVGLTLSPREQQVLALLTDGMSVPAIARSMFVSPSTAKTYVARLYEKLGACNRAQAIMTALRLGLIERQLSVPA
ncbi:response regulator transcription factor [Kribbella qitaiheensis]|uniref:Response regulator transcription factor n=1 Tax=Kribbella qitaiheensis TaxID=1544730 RepID=A0A7G6WWF8_9ACTN|nr:response regulator transcription factor [Kribbella qitaiheensis]QNE18323.1 response regulator transcription factor [Kribbella qitaiheensis]